MAPQWESESLESQEEKVTRRKESRWISFLLSFIDSLTWRARKDSAGRRMEDILSIKEDDLEYMRRYYRIKEDDIEYMGKYYQ